MSDLDDLRSRYLSAQLRGDRQSALGIMDEGMASGHSPLELANSVVRVAQREIGRLWQNNLIGIADEHMATAIAHLVLAQLYQRTVHAPRNGKRIFVACVEGERHDLPARLVSDALEAAGFEVWFLGADVPIDHLVHKVEHDTPDLMALSATMAFHATALRETVKRLRETRPVLPIAVGGGACEWSPGLADELNADLTASSAQDLVASARRLLGVAA